jgi:hypothetical protein
MSLVFDVVSFQKVGEDGVFAGGSQPKVARRPQTPPPKKKFTKMILMSDV